MTKQHPENSDALPPHCTSFARVFPSIFILCRVQNNKKSKETKSYSTKKDRLRRLQTSEHMPMEANSPTESNEYATSTNPCHAPTTEDRSGQIATSRAQIRTDRDNPPISLGALSSSLTSTCKSRFLHPNITYTRLISAWGSTFTGPLKMMHWTPEASWSSTSTEPLKAMRARLHWTPQPPSSPWTGRKS